MAPAPPVVAETGQVVIVPPAVAQWVVRSCVRLVASVAIVQGVNILIGGPQRWSAPAFATAMQAPDAPYSWGWALLAFGALTLLGSLAHRRMLVTAGLWLCAAWDVFFAVTLAKTAIDNPNAPTTGWITYALLAALLVVLGAAYQGGASRA